MENHTIQTKKGPDMTGGLSYNEAKQETGAMPR